MNSKVFSVVKYIVLLAVAFGLLSLAFKGIAVKAILAEMMQAKISWLLVSILIGVISFVSRAIRWKLLIESLGYSPSLKNTTASLMVGYFANLALPRLGEVTRCGSLSKAESVPFSSLLGTVIVERVVDVLTLLLLLLLSAIIEADRIGSFLHDTVIAPMGAKIHQIFSSTFIIVIGVLFILTLIIFIFLRTKKSGQSEGPSKMTQLLKGLINGLQSVTKLKRPWLFIFHSVFIWFLAFLGMYVSFFMLPSTSQLGWSAALFLLVIGGLGMAAPVQGGIGAFHLLVSQGLIIYGLSQQDGLAFATLVHSLSLGMVVAGGIISLFVLFTENRKKVVAAENEQLL